MTKYFCIHGHYYQPPREHPWLGEVEVEDSAFPHRDWNQRIAVECYAPNTAVPIRDAQDRIIDTVNNYSKTSFNLGPTLLSWLEKNRPDIYGAFLEADRLSAEHFSGHGSAISQVYNHMILPLANKRDKYTQVIWGIRDFQKRFGRDPEGMWLPEAAVDTKSLEVLAELAIKFTILSPRQARRVRRLGNGTWNEVKQGEIDSTQAYLCSLPSGRTISLFFYDGAIASEVAFGELLKNGEDFARRLMNGFSENAEHSQLVHIATDGETYGHHHRYGEMALAYCLRFIESSEAGKITNYGEYLERHPPTQQVQILEPSSWSCVHGVERWRSHCDCNSGKKKGWTQAWRGPLRKAMDQLQDQLLPLYEREALQYLKNPVEARNDYIEVVMDRSRGSIKSFFARHAPRRLTQEETQAALRLLEMQRSMMLAYTSCGWFFDDISGIESVRVMQHALRAMQLAEEWLGKSLESQYVSTLKEAPSNVYQDGARVYELFVKPVQVKGLTVASKSG